MGSAAIKAQQISELNEKLERAAVERAEGEQVLKTEVQKKSSLIDELTDKLEAVNLAPPKPVADSAELEAKVQRLESEIKVKDHKYDRSLLRKQRDKATAENERLRANILRL